MTSLLEGRTFRLDHWLPLGRALLFSLGAHGLLLLSVAPLLVEKPVLSATPLPAQIVARIVPPSASSRSSSRLPVDAVASEEPRTRAVPPHHKISARSPARVRVPPVPAVTAVPPPSTASPAPTLAPTRQAHVPSAAVPASRVDAVAPPLVAGAAIDADDLRQYRMALAMAARRFRHYPALARERGWEGVAEVELLLDRFAAPQLRMHVSSGHALLDEAALEMLRQGARLAPVPTGLSGQEIRVLLPVRFSLDD